MKILNCNKFYHVRGGADTYFLELNRLLTENGHKVIPFTMKDEKNLYSEFEDFFVKHIQFPSDGKISLKSLIHLLKNGFKGIYSLEAQDKVKTLVKKFKPDLAHIHNIRYQITPSILPALKKFNLPIVMTVNDYKLVCPNHALFDGKRTCQDCENSKYHKVIFKKCFKGSYLYSFLVYLEMYLNKLLKIYENKGIKEYV